VPVLNDLNPRQWRLLPQLIHSVDTITGEMDSIGHQAGDSIWQQMVLVFRRSPASYPLPFFLALATEQYGVYLAVCPRPDDASGVSYEAVAMAKELSTTGGFGAFVECGLGYRFFRQPSLLESKRLTTLAQKPLD
jgi:hypothetical protein